MSNKARQMISCFKGLAPVSFPAEWLDHLVMDTAFAEVDGEARIRFFHPDDAWGRAYGVSVYGGGPNLERSIRKLSREESIATDWGPFCSPWETYQTAQVFGYGPVTPLDQI